MSSYEDNGGRDKSASRSLTVPETRLDLLTAIRANPTILVALRAVGVSQSGYRHARATDPEFGIAVDEARLEGWERLEAATYDEAMKDSVPGVNTSKLKEFLLKGRKRHVYGDRLSVESEHRHEVHINLVPINPAQPAPALPETVEGAEFTEIRADLTPESEEP